MMNDARRAARKSKTGSGLRQPTIRLRSRGPRKAEVATTPNLRVNHFSGPSALPQPRHDPQSVLVAHARDELVQQSVANGTTRVSA
jgi:hypothetical protein